LTAAEEGTVVEFVAPPRGVITVLVS
jgi:hypothetical protein